MLTFLAIIDVLSPQTLQKHRASILVGLRVVSCFITPGADPYSPLILGAAFTILYCISEGLIHLMSPESSAISRSCVERG